MRATRAQPKAEGRAIEFYLPNIYGMSMLLENWGDAHGIVGELWGENFIFISMFHPATGWPWPNQVRVNLVLHQRYIDEAFDTAVAQIKAEVVKKWESVANWRPKYDTRPPDDPEKLARFQVLTSADLAA